MKPGDSKDETGVKRLIRICPETLKKSGGKSWYQVGPGSSYKCGEITPISRVKISPVTHL